MPFSPPKTAAFKQFIILDEDGVIAALSAIDGGQIDEILTRSAEDEGDQTRERAAGGSGQSGRKTAKSKKVEEEIRRARTRHATAAKLLEALHSHEAIGVVEGVLDDEVAQQIEPGMVLQFRGELRLHPLHQADQLLRSFLKMAPKFGEKKVAAELRPMIDLWGAMVGTDQSDSRLLIEPHTAEHQRPRLILPVPRPHLEVDVDDVLGQVTVIAQVERMLPETEQFPAIRMLRGAPATPFERSALEEGLPALIDALGEMGFPISEDDIFIHGPALILRAICVYR
jgi:hypothetical protein